MFGINNIWIVVILLLLFHLFQLSLEDYDKSLPSLDRNKFWENKAYIYRLVYYINLFYIIFYIVFVICFSIYYFYKKNVQKQLFSNLVKQQNQTSTQLCNTIPVTFNPTIEWITYIFQWFLFVIFIINLLIFGLLSMQTYYDLNINKNPEYINDAKYFFIPLFAFFNILLNISLWSLVDKEKQHMRDLFAEQQTEKAIACLCPTNTLPISLAH